MSVAVATRKPATLAPEDLLTMPDGERYELIDGRLAERSMGARSAWVELKLGAALLAFCEARDLGWVLPGTTGYRCFPHAPDRIRRPDASFLATDLLPDRVLPEGFVMVAPSLAVEIVSPRDLASELEDKLDDYRSARIRLIWVTYPASRSAMIYRGDGSMTRIRDHEDLVGEDILPGFRLPLASILPPPSASSAGATPPVSTETESGD